IPLVVERSGLFTVARLPGGRHANANFPAVAGPQTARLDVAAMGAAVAGARPDIDLMLLERLEPHRFGVANPFVGATAAASPNPALAVNLEGGFDRLMERVSGKRKRKKHRSQSRKFE